MTWDPAVALRPTVCFVAANHGVAWGASEFLWAGAAGELLAQGNLHVVACVGERSLVVPAIDRLRRAGCTIVARPREEDEEAFGRTAVPDSSASKLATLQPDLVVVSQGDNREGFPWMEHFADSGVPYVSLAHRASEWDWPHSVIVDRLRGAYLGATATHFVSEHNLRLTERMICADLPHASVVRNPFGVDYDRTVPWPASSDTFRLACVARFDLESKAHDVLLDVLAEPKWRRRTLEVDLIGREGPHLELIGEMRTFLGLEQVHIRTSVDDIRAVWAECHGLVLPSRKEGLPVAIVEAMLAGRPCIGTDVGGVSEVVEHGRSGWVAESPTAAALDRALESAWRSRHDWNVVGAHASRQIRSLVPRDPVGAYVDLLVQVLRQVSG